MRPTQTQEQELAATESTGRGNSLGFDTISSSNGNFQSPNSKKQGPISSEDLSETNEEDQITWEEYCETVEHQKDSKTPGADNIPVEVWKGSTVSKRALFEFLQKVWRKETDTVRESCSLHIRYDLQEKWLP